jgi:endonuclease YncB( thermonuclease family)
MIKPYVFRLHLVRVVDGDTLFGHLDVGVNIKVERQYVRLHGVNAPEIRGVNVDPVAGPAARAFVAEWCDAADVLVVDSIRFNPGDQFKRVVGILYRDVDPVSLNDALIVAGHAVPAKG